MALFLVAPILLIVYVSFWTQTTFKIEPTLTLASWKTFFGSDTYISSLWTTLRIWLIVLAATFVIGYPTALFVGLFVKNKTLSTVLLVICVIPFWTSFLIRVLAWRPMLGKEGAINILLQKAGIISQPIEALLFTELSVIIGMTQIYVRLHGRADCLHAGPHRSQYHRGGARSGRRLLAHFPQDHFPLEPARRRRRRHLRQSSWCWANSPPRLHFRAAR